MIMDVEIKITIPNVDGNDDIDANLNKETNGMSKDAWLIKVTTLTLVISLSNLNCDRM